MYLTYLRYIRKQKSSSDRSFYFNFRDDHKLLKWNLVNNECIVVATFADDFYPTGMHLFPKSNVGGNKHQHDVILISSADGK